MAYRNWLTDDDLNRRGILGYDYPEVQQGFNLTGQVQHSPLLTPRLPVAPQPSYAPQGRFAAPMATGSQSPTGKNFFQKAAGFLGSPLGVGLIGEGLNYLGGGDQRRFAKEQRNNARWAWGKAKSEYGRDILNPADTAWAVHAAAIPRMNKLGEGLTRKYGLDAGRAGGALANEMLSTEAQAWLDAYLQNAGLKTQRDAGIRGLLGG